VRVTVTDDGAGLPEGFAIEATTGLGLSIVRTLVTTELGGTIVMERGRGDPRRPGTVVVLRIPLAEETPADLFEAASGPPARTDPTGRPDGRGAHAPSNSNSNSNSTSPTALPADGDQTKRPPGEGGR
jgi:hypothetical protein